MNDASDSTGMFRRRARDRLSTSVALVAVKNDADAFEGIIKAVPIRSARNDPSFLAHLIAIAERYPQTRVLRRASPQDAEAAYRDTDAKGHAVRLGISTRQDI